MVLGLGPTEMVIVVFVIVLLILGPKKIPQLFRSMGKAIGEFKKGKTEVEDEVTTNKEKKAKK